ncbi:hypothetical protein ACRAWD_01385 [Caulobacter segnis]
MPTAAIARPAVFVDFAGDAGGAESGPRDLPAQDLAFSLLSRRHPLGS